MNDMILWRKITRTDILSMMGEAAPAGTGGGAKHIALGVNSREFPIHEFLDITSCKNKNIRIEPIPGFIEAKQVEFSCKADRRGGEWRISRQHLDRYPLWTERYGFPKDADSYDPDNPPVIFVVRISGEYHARFCMLSQTAGISADLDRIIRESTRNSGVEVFQQQMGGLFGHLIPPSDGDERIASSNAVSGPATTPTQTTTPDSYRPSPPSTTSSFVTRYIRDSAHGKELKNLYGYKCTFCDATIRRPHDTPYVETCHVKPLNEKGLDTKGNILILCPNHHVELDFGTVTMDPDTMTLLHIDSTNSLNGKTVQLKHQVDREYLEFHFQRWKNRKLRGY